MPLPGDWVCGSCQYLNFFWRVTCRACNEPVVGQSRILGFGTVPRVFHFGPGDWYCDVELCRAHNFAGRLICYKCGVLKGMPSSASIGCHNPVFPCMTFGQGVVRLGRRGWKDGDWICGRSGCNAHNYGARVECFRCNSSRELIGSIYQ